MNLAQIGMQFSYLGKSWIIVGFSTQKVFFRLLGGDIQSQMDLKVFLKEAECISA